MAKPPAYGPSGPLQHRMGRFLFQNNPLVRDLLWRCLAETIGTWLMVFAGTSVVAAAVLAGAQVGLWQVAVAWAVGVSMAIYLTAAVSGAHLNPAVSLSFAIFRPRDFPLRLLLPYWASQLLGRDSGGSHSADAVPAHSITPIRGAARAGKGRPGQSAVFNDVRRVFPQSGGGGNWRGGAGPDFAPWRCRC